MILEELAREDICLFSIGRVWNIGWMFVEVVSNNLLMASNLCDIVIEEFTFSVKLRVSLDCLMMLALRTLCSHSKSSRSDWLVTESLSVIMVVSSSDVFLLSLLTIRKPMAFIIAALCLGIFPSLEMLKSTFVRDSVL